MDTIGLLAAWVGIVSFLFAIVIGFVAHLVTPRYQRWWAKTSKRRAEKRLEHLLRDLDVYHTTPDNGYIADLISLYGSIILNVVAAVGLVIMSIEILDLGPALLASILPFNVDSKMLTRISGILTLTISYYLIARLAYLATRLRVKTFPRKPENAERMLDEVSELRARLGSRVA